MRVHLVLIVLAFAAARAHAEPAAADASVIGGKIYLASGFENLTFANAEQTAGAATIDVGHRLGEYPIYAHLAVGGGSTGYMDAHGGLELRAGGVVKGIFGIDTGYQHDPRMTDRMFSVEGPYVAPRLGLEVGTETFWLRGLVDWRYTIAQGDGRASAFALIAGHDF
jgi:hypothetical protein